MSNSKSLKAASLQTNKLITNQVLQSSKGYTFLGDTYETQNVNNSTEQETPENSFLGTSESNGNISRSLYNLNSAGPIIYSPTSDDRQQVVKKFSNIVATNIIASSFPWLYPPNVSVNRSQNTQELIDSRTPIYKCLGKGVGEVHFYKAGSPQNGNESMAGTSTDLFRGTRSKSFIPDTETMYPFNGYIYSGNIVQLIREVDEETGISSTRVIPYQSGRGIPLYSTNYEPEENTPITPFAPFGELVWPATQNTMSPSISRGVEPGDTNICVGMVLDTFSPLKPNERMFPITQPNGFDIDTLNEDSEIHEPYYNHPAPHTVPAASAKNGSEQGFFSPGPNLSNTYFSPWPRYYAYQTNEPIPVLTKGITTARIGACTNIALMSSAIRRQISATDESWVPQLILPLFEGERLEAGSYIYASAKGNIMSAGPFQPIDYLGESSTQIEKAVSVGAIGQTPWDVYVDSTWGNIGWTSTPGLSFSFIPDQSTSIIEVLQDENGNSKTIPFLNQSNQGSIIVQGITSVNPSPATGNAYLQSQYDLDNLNLTSEEEVLDILQKRAELTGISGRCALPQVNPDKAQPIGILLETIRGTGRWSYTALPVDTTTNFDGVLVTGGVVYGNPQVINNTPVRTNTGAGAGGEVAWTTFEDDPPNLGTITGGLSLPVPGTHAVGDIVTAIDNSLNWDVNEFQYHGNNAAFTIEAGNTVSLQSGGTNYVADTKYFAFNLSLNNGYFDFNENGGNLNFTGTLVGSDYYQNFSKYPVNTIFRALYKSNGFSTTAYFKVDNFLSYTSLEISRYVLSNVYSLTGDVFLETEQCNFNTLAGDVEVNVLTVGSDGEILTFEIVDYGLGHLRGDRIIVINGTQNPGMDVDNNGVIEFPGVPPGQQEIIATGPRYTETANPYITVGLNGVVATPTINVITDPNVEYLPIVFQNAGAAGIGELLRLQYSGGFNMTDPWYHSNCVTFFASASDNTPWRGGSGYETAINVSCYNLTANSLRVHFTVQDEVVTVQASDPYSDDNYQFDVDRYTFDATNGTQVRLLQEGVSEDLQEIIRLVSFDSDTNTLTTSRVQAGGLYPNLLDQDYIFQTQRLDQTNPTVDILVDETKSPPKIIQVKMRTAGTNNQNGDLMLITQPGSDFNAIFLYNDNMPYIDLPPYAVRPGFRVKDDDEAWERYSNVMSNALNLFDKQVLIELRNIDDQNMEDIPPYGMINANASPPTQDVYRQDYEYLY